MGNVRFTAAAQSVTQLDTLTLGGTWLAGDTITLTIAAKTLTLTLGTTVTTTQIGLDIVAMVSGAAVNGDESRSEIGTNVPEFTEITAAAASATTVTFTANTSGKPFTLTVAKVSTSGTVSLANTTVATGPQWWDNDDNWDTGTAPITGDDVFLDHSEVDILYGLDQSAVTLATLNIAATYTGRIGLPKLNQDGTEYVEYRPDYLSIGATVVNIGLGDGNGSSRIKLNLGSVESAVNVYGSGGGEGDLAGVLVKGTHIDNTLSVRAGSVDVAPFGGEVATFATVKVSGGAELYLGEGVTWTTLDITSGSVEVNSTGTTVTMLDGTLVVQSGGITTLTVRGGSCDWRSTGTLGTAVVSGNGLLTFDSDPRAKVVTNAIDLHGTAASIADSQGVVSNLRVDFNEGAGAQQLSWGMNYRLTRGAVS